MAVDNLLRAPSGQYSNFSEYNPATQQHAPPIEAETPSAAVLNVSLPPYAEQVHRFETCTTTPQPDNSNYRFSAAAPRDVEFLWITGERGRAAFA